MRLWRVEDKQGRGPYQWNSALRYPFSDGPPGQPYGAIEFGDNSANGWRYAFPTMQSLLDWFDAERRAWLKAHGFVIRVYEAERVLKTERQAIFHDGQFTGEEITL